MESLFKDRSAAGEELALRLMPYGAQKPIVLALPRGGLPVAYPIATALDAPLDIWIVRKIGLPWHREFGIGAVAEGGIVHLNDDVIRQVGMSRDEIEHAMQRTKLEVNERVERFRGRYSPPAIAGRTVIVVDDGIATGGTMHAALLAIRAMRPKYTVLAVPVAAEDSLAVLASLADDIICLHTPEPLRAVGIWYEDFTQVTDQDVVRLLDRARRERQTSPSGVNQHATSS